MSLISFIIFTSISFCCEAFLELRFWIYVKNFLLSSYLKENLLLVVFIRFFYQYKSANIVLNLKIGSKNSKENYRPAIILPNISKIYERCLFSQMSSYSLVPNRRPTPLINFSNFFQPGHSYSNPPAIKFWEKFYPTQSFKIFPHFV